MKALGYRLSPDVTGRRSVDRHLTPQHTPDHKNCAACREAELELVRIDSNVSRLPFAQAAAQWLALRRQSNLKESTHKQNEYYIRCLNKFFGALRLCDITAGHLKSYQELRATNPVIAVDAQGREVRNWDRAAGNSIINHELCCLALIMQGKLRKGQTAPHAKLWGKLKPYYFPKSMPKWSPAEVLSVEDEEEFFRLPPAIPKHNSRTGWRA